MSKQGPTEYLVYDPLLGKAVTSRKQWRQAATLRDGWERANNHWSVCTLCWRQTEISECLLNVRRFRCRRDGTFEPVSPPERSRIARWAKRITLWYLDALHGKYGPFGAARLIVTFCDIKEAQGEFRSPEEFFDLVERRLLERQWRKRAPYAERLYWPGALSEFAGEGSSRDRRISQARYPSAVYCERHNPNRSPDARTLYQRDRRVSTVATFRESFELLRGAIRPGAWTVEEISKLRRLAYVSAHTKRHHALRHLVDHHQLSIAAAGRLLGISRQAASASLARHPLATCPQEAAALIDDLVASIDERLRRPLAA